MNSISAKENKVAMKIKFSFYAVNNNLYLCVCSDIYLRFCN